MTKLSLAPFVTKYDSFAVRQFVTSQGMALVVLEAKNSSDPICQAYKLKSIAETDIKVADGRI